MQGHFAYLEAVYLGFGRRRYSGNGWEALEMRYCYNKGKVTHKSLVALRVPTALHA